MKTIKNEKIKRKSQIYNCCILYTLISKLPWPKKFSHKVLLVAFIGTHIPLITFSSYVLLSNKLSAMNWIPIFIILIATLVGTLITLLTIQSLIKPIEMVSLSLKNYADNGKVIPLPRNYNDEIGQLMRDADDTIERLDIAIKQLNNTQQQTKNSLDIAITQNMTLDRLSKIDALTGLANRRHLDDYMKSEFSRCTRTNQAFSILILDVDKFKLFNDLEGHIAGDTCLIKIGQLLLSVPRRASDFIGRFGGEEFCIILPDTQHQGAIDFAEKLRLVIYNSHIKHPQSPSGFVTASIGVSSTTPTINSNVNDLLDMADKALYKAKNNGRNRVEFLSI